MLQALVEFLVGGRFGAGSTPPGVCPPSAGAALSAYCLHIEAFWGPGRQRPVSPVLGRPTGSKKIIISYFQPKTRNDNFWSSECPLCLKKTEEGNSPWSRVAMGDTTQGGRPVVLNPDMKCGGLNSATVTGQIHISSGKLTPDWWKLFYMITRAWLLHVIKCFMSMTKKKSPKYEMLQILVQWCWPSPPLLWPLVKLCSEAMLSSV